MRLLRVALVLTALFTAPLHAQQQTVDTGFALDPDGVVRIYNYIGSVKVIGWDRDSISVTGTVPAGMHLFGGGPRSGVKLGVEGNQIQGAQAADLVVHLPARARISVIAAATEVDISAISGEIDVANTTGRIRIDGTPREVKAESMSGDIEISASPSYLRAKTATGRITWTGSSDDVAFSTVTGRTSITAGSVLRARFESIDGEIRFSGNVANAAAVTIDTHSGDVVLALKKNASVEVEADIAFGDLFGTRPRADHKPISRTVGSPGLGGAHITIRSFKGRLISTLQ